MIIIDHPRWAFDNIVYAIRKFNTDSSISIDVQNIFNTSWMEISWHRYDVIYLICWFLYSYISFIPEETGFIIERDVDAIADKIDLLKNNYDLCKRMGENIRGILKTIFHGE